MQGMIFSNQYKMVKGQAAIETVLSDANYPLSGSYIDISKTERFFVVVDLGTVADNVVFEIKVADSTTGTLDVIDATNCKKTIANATDDGQLIIFTIETKKLAQDHYHVSCVVSGTSGSNYATITFFLDEHTKPVVQSAIAPSDNLFVYAGAV